MFGDNIIFLFTSKEVRKQKVMVVRINGPMYVIPVVRIPPDAMDPLGFLRAELNKHQRGSRVAIDLKTTEGRIAPREVARVATAQQRGRDVTVEFIPSGN